MVLSLYYSKFSFCAYLYCVGVEQGDASNPNERVVVQDPFSSACKVNEPCTYKVVVRSSPIFEGRSQDFAIVITSFGVVVEPTTSQKFEFLPSSVEKTHGRCKGFNCDDDTVGFDDFLVRPDALVIMSKIVSRLWFLSHLLIREP